MQFGLNVVFLPLLLQGFNLYEGQYSWVLDPPDPNTPFGGEHISVYYVSVGTVALCVDYMHSDSLTPHSGPPTQWGYFIGMYSESEIGFGTLSTMGGLQP